jgi:hypothetical protein
VSNLPLDYRGRPDPDERPADPFVNVILATVSLGMIAVPVIGAATRNGAMFIFGGLLAPVLGMVLAGVVMVKGRPGGVTLCGFALIANAIFSAFFIWRVFVVGLC